MLYSLSNKKCLLVAFPFYLMFRLATNFFVEGEIDSMIQSV